MPYLLPSIMITLGCIITLLFLFGALAEFFLSSHKVRDVQPIVENVQFSKIQSPHFVLGLSLLFFSTAFASMTTYLFTLNTSHTSQAWIFGVTIFSFICAYFFFNKAQKKKTHDNPK